jgi:Protein of unknown function (DUF2892)
MNTNVGSIDRAVRIVAGLALLSLVFLLNGSARWLGLIGVVPLLTASFRFCPLYTVLGISTCPAEQKRP